MTEAGSDELKKKIERQKWTNLRNYLATVTGANFNSSGSVVLDWPYTFSGFERADFARWDYFSTLTKGPFVLVITRDGATSRSFCYLGIGHAALWNRDQVAHTIFYWPVSP